VRRLYILKQLASRQMWAGASCTMPSRWRCRSTAGGAKVPVEPFIEDAIERMRGEWRGSRDGLYREKPKTLALFEHEYVVTSSARSGRCSAASEHVPAQFLPAAAAGRLRKTAPEHWSIEHWSKVFDFEARWCGSRRTSASGTTPAASHWWTGRPGPAIPDANGVPARVLRALRARVLGVEPAKVDLLEANLREPTVTPLAWDDARWSTSASSSGSRSARCAPTVAPDGNRRGWTDFERTEELRICRWCNFKAVVPAEVS